MRRHLFTHDLTNGATVAWYTEEPRLRTYLVKQRVSGLTWPENLDATALQIQSQPRALSLPPLRKRYPFPALAHAVVRDRRGRFSGLHTYMAEEGGSLTRVRKLRVSNTGLLGVCLGSSRHAVERGHLDPIDAFWLTTFDLEMPDRSVLAEAATYTIADIEAMMVRVMNDIVDGYNTIPGYAAAQAVATPTTARVAPGVYYGPGPAPTNVTNVVTTRTIVHVGPGSTARILNDRGEVVGTINGPATIEV